MECIKGMVKKTPIKQPIKPTIEAMPAKINRPKSTKGCFKTMAILDFRESIAFKFPKTINGIDKNVKKDSVTAIKDPTNLIPLKSSKRESPEPMRVTNNVENIIRVRYGAL